MMSKKSLAVAAVCVGVGIGSGLVICSAAGEALESKGVDSKQQAMAIKHRFLAMDESRGQLLYVDQSDPSKDWTLKLPARFRDMQLVGDGKILVSTAEGYAEYSLATREVVKEVKGYKGSVAARRTADGRTILACNSAGVTVFEFDADGKELRKANFKTGQTRLVRLTPRGTFLFGSGDKVIEGDLDGNVVKTVTIDKSRGMYQVLRKSNGNLLMAGGYDPAVVETDSEGKVLKRWGGKESAEAKDLGFFFFAGMQVLKNGDTVASNWTGHGANDSAKGAQIVQFNEAGNVVWKWHDPERAGCIHGVIVLDDLDTKVLIDDTSSVLGPVQSAK